MYILGIDPSEASSGIAVLEYHTGIHEIISVNHLPKFDMLKYLELITFPIDRIVIERCPRGNFRLALSYYTGMEFVRRCESVFKGVPIRCISPSTWQAKFTSASNKVKRKERKILALEAATEIGYEGKSTDEADAICIGCYHRYIKDWPIVVAEADIWQSV